MPPDVTPVVKSAATPAPPGRGALAGFLRLRGLSARRTLTLQAWLAPVVLLLPTLTVLVFDWWHRQAQIRAFSDLHRLTYAAAALESAVLWSVLLGLASRRRGRARWYAAGLFVLLWSTTVAGQGYFHEQYNAYLNADVSVFASNFMDSVANQLLADAHNYSRFVVPVTLLAIGFVWLGRKVVRPRRSRSHWALALALPLLIAAMFVPTQHRMAQASTPDVLYLNAAGGLVRTQLGLTEQSNQVRPKARESLPVGPLQPAPGLARNVLFVILESVRADSTCVRHDPECKRTESTNRLFPERFAFTQMRSLDSCTAVSLAVLWSGVGPHESREVMHSWPLIFDYARAAGYSTAFWTSQNMMFGNARLWVKNLGVDRFVSATDLDSTSDLDLGAPEGLLADRVISELDSLKPPFLGVIQLSNVHYPYFVDPELPQPFQPAELTKAPEENAVFKNHYQNSVYQQDLHLARILKHLRSTPAGANTVIVYTSDHAEAFREHGQMGHTFSVFDEEVKVPAWIDAPEGTLSPEEAGNLKAKADELLFHVDLAPTILDLMRVWDAPELERYKSRMLGTSLLRKGLTTRALPMTNCASVWSCAFENWGYMRGSKKLEAREWDPGWHCYDVLDDPFERNDLGVEACGDLKSLALQTFKRRPGENKPGH
jgi:glucan phosphoethanolaminetransferase (alkaline phosphatase superfamily)